MKKIIIKTSVFVLTFVLTIIIAGRFMNRGNNDMTMKMGSATLPVVTFLQGDVAVNELHGYTVKMDVASQAYNVIQLGESREISFYIDSFGKTLSDVTVEVRSSDGNRLIEKIEDLQPREDGKYLRVDTTLKDLLDKDTEYAVVVLLTDASGKEIRYYTRGIWGTEKYAAEKVAFVKEFYETTFDKEAAKELTKYLESNSTGDNTTFHKVNIHSSLSQVTWGELNVKPVSEPVIDILELGTDTGSFALKSMVSTGEGKDIEYYAVEEFYRIRYTASRVYLLDFERTMTQLPQVEGDIYGNDKIMLGIAGKNIQMIESEDGNFLAFETAGRLCTYNVQGNKMSVLYSFYDAENWDTRTIYNAHDIKILNVDEKGNVKFAVYGYFNRGRHEGENGISLYAFDSGLNSVEELVHIPYEKSWQMLKTDIEKLCFLNENGKFYVYLDQGLHEINVETKEDTVIMQLQTDNTLHTSANHQIVLWNQKDALQILNLETEERTKVPVAAGEIMQALGFMGSDVIYGVVKEADILEDASGRDIIPMYKVLISDASGHILKTYREDGIYTLSVDIVDNQITLNRVKSSDKGGYVSTVPEHIVNNEEQKIGKNKIVTAAVAVYETITQIQVKKNIDSKTIQILTPKEMIYEGSREVDTVKEETPDLYYVYNRHGVDEVYLDPAAAVALAYETSGRVVDRTGKTIWFKGNRVARNQIMAITEPEKTSVTGSLASCLDTMLKFNGITAQSQLLLDEGMDAPEILKEHLVNAKVADLTGCAMDAVLYFVNKDIPVLAILSSGEAVLITGFNEYNVVIFEPSTGKLYKKGMNDSTKWFAENGNCFITYFEAE